MTQVEMELLLKDLSARIPYGVNVEYDDGRQGVLLGVDCEILLGYDPTVVIFIEGETKGLYTSIHSVKPYLRPMSNMTWEEQMMEEGFALGNVEGKMDFYNSHHLDYRGLIEQGLAIEAPNDMYEEVLKES